MGSLFLKDPDATLDYIFDWSEWLDKAAVKDETFTSDYDVPVSLAHSNLVTESVVVSSTDGVTTFVEGMDYTIDYGNGTVTVLSTGDMQNSTQYSISYEYNTETISSYVVTASTGITVVSDSVAGGIVTVWLSGGEVGKTYTVSCKITTSYNRIDERSMFVVVNER